MNSPTTSARRAARAVARIGLAGSLMMLAVTAWSGVVPVDAAENAGNATISEPTTGAPLLAGQKDTDFTLKLPEGAACTGDSANDGYRVQSFMVPEGVDPATLTYGNNGPEPLGVGDEFSQPLYRTTTEAYVNQQTANATTPGGPGPIINIPAFDFMVFTDPGMVPAGTYILGISCTAPTTGDVDRFWTAKMTVTADAAEWTAVAQQEPPATTTTSTTTSSTTPAGNSTTTTTTGGGTTTTTLGTDTTTTTLLSDSSNLAAAGGSSSGGSSTGGGSGTTDVAGTSTGALARSGIVNELLVWAALALGFGYLLYLAAMSPQTRDH